ncbi:MAG: serine/threonine-protein kinase [Polyangiaceae bacterium]
MAKGKKPRLNPGDVVGGRYRITGVVGRGGFGAVYSATQLDTGAEVALKVLLKSVSAAKVDAKRFKREAALVQKLQHPNVVQLLDFGYTENDESYIAFELLRGTALSKVLKADPKLPLYRASQISRDVLGALAAAHTIGVIHRDIKPGNVFLLEGSDVAKVLDFGIAKAMTGEEAGGTQLTEAGQMIGTPQYMAPEQVRGTGIFPSTDVYSLGLLFAEMIAGHRIVKGNSLIDIYMMHISPDPLPLPPSVVDSPVGAIIEKAVRKVPDERFATASEMLGALDRALPGLPGGAARPTGISGTHPAVRGPQPSDVEPSAISGAAALKSMAPSMAAPVGRPAPALDTGTIQMDRPDLEAARERLARAVAAQPKATTPLSREVVAAASAAGASASSSSIESSSISSSSLPAPASFSAPSSGSGSVSSHPAPSSGPPRSGGASDSLEATVDMSSPEIAAIARMSVGRGPISSISPLSSDPPPAFASPAPPPAPEAKASSDNARVAYVLLVVALLLATGVGIWWWATAEGARHQIAPRAYRVARMRATARMTDASLCIAATSPRGTQRASSASLAGASRRSRAMKAKRTSKWRWGGSLFRAGIAWTSTSKIPGRQSSSSVSPTSSATSRRAACSTLVSSGSMCPPG